MKVQDCYVGMRCGWTVDGVVYTGVVEDMFQTQNVNTGLDTDYATVQCLSDPSEPQWQISIKRLMGLVHDSEERKAA